MPDTATRQPGSRSATDIDVFVGQRVRELRNEARLTLTDLGSKLHISHQQLQKYETGANRFSAGMLYETARALGVSVADLFPGHGDTADTGRAAIRTVEAIRRVLKGAV